MRVLVRFLAIVGALTILLVVLGIALAIRVSGMSGTGPMPKDIVLKLDLDQPLAEHQSDEGLPGVFGRAATVRGIVETLDRAAADPKVKGLIATLGNASPGMGKAQELRDAVTRFRSAGKFTLAYADTFGEFQPSDQAYYLATGFDEIWMQPLGNLNLTGLLSELPFGRGALEKLKITPEVSRRYEYKSAAEMMGEYNATPANREMTESLLDDLFQQLVTGIAERRKLAPETVQALIDRAPLLDKESLQAKLIDRLGYLDEVEDSAKKQAGEHSGVVEFDDYAASIGPAKPDGEAVALIVGSGTIMRGSGESNPLLGSETMGSDAVSDAFADAIEDDHIKAILFRVDSPGGSAVASEVVRRAVQRAKAAGKPVVVSMSDVAGSGGYWVAMDADKIVAQPGTFTGSIGVFSTKFATEDMWREIGVSWTLLGRGRNATLYSSVTGYSDTEKQRVDAMLDDIYGSFTAGVAAGRSLPIEEVRKIARGRVWTGRQAKERGLVDALGGYDVALQQVRVAMNVRPDTKLHLVEFPKPKSGIEVLYDLLASRTGLAEQTSRAATREVAASLRPLLAHIAPLLPPPPGETLLRMPAVGIGGY